MNDNIVILPCLNMIFDKDHYHKCRLLLAPKISDPTTREEYGSGFCCCAWFFDAVGPTIHIETSVVNGKVGLVSDFDFPDIPHEPEPNKDNVPKICPKGYTFEQIDAKMKAFDPSFFIDKVLT